MYDTILFDLDGTLVNSALGITEGVRYALEKCNMEPLPYAIREKFIGPPMRQSFQKYCFVDEEKAEMLLALYREYYGTQGLHESEAYPGIPELLQRLTDKGKELIVATAKPTKYSKIILEELGIASFFREIIGAGFEKNFETKDKIIRLAKSMAKHEKIIMVGDTYFDVDGARVNGIPAIGVLYGFGDHTELRKSKPLYIAETVEEIEAYI
ncbi:MAG: HAD-IA family hydrolase [Clostridia bacterium]|nr:HAD-IA family hydrolase [Clostridia bacterium]